MEKMRTIAIAMEKGGVGKTNVATNIACGLARRGYMVVLIDTDSQGNVSPSLGLEDKQGDRCISDLFTGKKKFKEVAILARKNLLVVPSSKKLADVIEDIGLDCTREARRDGKHPTNNYLKNLISKIKGPHFVIIDTPPLSGLIQRNAYCAADEIVAPIDCETLAVIGLKHLSNTMKVARNLNPRIKLSGILITKFDARRKEDRAYEQVIMKYAGPKLFTPRIPNTTMASQGVSTGQAALEKFTYKDIGFRYNELIDEIIERGNTEQGEK